MLTIVLLRGLKIKIEEFLLASFPPTNNIFPPNDFDATKLL